MCDFSLHAVKSRPAEVGDELTTHQFPFGNSGLLCPGRYQRCRMPTSGDGVVVHR